ncbi:MAG TPA: 2'-deoxycytidine 5'-triphosphate deaminase [Bryobacteraceae bacterium]|nr:2'-deoxycytidine 5'-triphosphate deaminase [Bryobacteraceae bacterium]
MDLASRSLFPELEGEDRALHSAGILPSQRIRGLIEAGHITACAPISDEQIQPASIDLRLGPVAYRVRAGLLPGASTVERKLEQFGYQRVDLTRPALLERGCVYIVPLIESLALPTQISARGNPKSTIGRLDVFTRLMADYGVEFDRIPGGYAGKLYVEIVPQSFGIVAREGIRIYQARFVKGNAGLADRMLEKLEQRIPLVFGQDERPAEANIDNGLRISLDLEGVTGSEIVGYRARKNAPPVELDRVDYFDPAEFWDPLVKPKQGQMIIDPGDFYLLLSKQKIRVPPQSAAELVPFDPQMGEFRVHYAGFFDPGFGYGAGDINGTHAVLEVRAHGVPFLFADDQLIGRLVFEELLEIPSKIYGPAIGSSYQRQGLSLSKQFRRQELGVRRQ